jgi:hypothetical protein
VLGVEAALLLVIEAEAEERFASYIVSRRTAARSCARLV